MKRKLVFRSEQDIFPQHSFGRAQSFYLLTVIWFSRASQLVAGILIVVITWRHTYQSTHRLRKFGVEVGTFQVIRYILIYNGESSAIAFIAPLTDVCTFTRKHLFIVRSASS